jgi:hypothetical protein
MIAGWLIGGLVVLYCLLVLLTVLGVGFVMSLAPQSGPDAVTLGGAEYLKGVISARALVEMGLSCINFADASAPQNWGAFAQSGSVALHEGRANTCLF